MLHDLEELVLKCRDDRARAYIGEAVGCYRAGSYRAAIVATWIAVAFDIIDKMRELALAGDKEAERLTTDFEVIRKSHDVVKSLAFERDLLKLARDKFELISPLEHQDLERIQDDRHRCAHPSHTSDAEIFSPPAELARLHIRSAVEILLRHEPAQGKAALDGLMKEIESPYFPDNDKDAQKILEKGPLRRARPSLARNFIIVLLKTMLAETDYKRFWRQRAAFQCSKILHPDIWRKTLTSDLTRLYRALSDDDTLTRGCRVLLADTEVWTLLDEGQQTRMKAYVRDMPTNQVTYIDEILEYEPLAPSARVRVSKMTPKDFNNVVFFILPDIVAERLVNAYAASHSFDDANSWGKVIQVNAADLTTPYVKRLIEAAGNNSQIQGSFQLAGVLQALRKTKTFADAEFNSLLVANGLSEFL